MRPTDDGASSRSLEELRLAQFTGMVLDIPPRVRLVIGIAAVAGLGLIVMQSLVGHQPGTIGVDKIIHFCGYGLLAAVFVTALRPALFLPVLLMLVAIGLAIEGAQPLMGRERDVRDAAANGLGVAIGAGVGLLVRSLYAWMRRDLALSVVSRKRVRYRAGAVVAREGDPVLVLQIIRSGEGRATRLTDGQECHLAALGPGDVVGLIGLLQGQPQYATVTAHTPMTLYRMTLEELIDAAGGPAQPIAAVLQATARLVNTLADQKMAAETRQEPLRRPGDDIRPRSDV